MKIDDVTERQRQCLRLVLSGLRDKEIGRELGISHETVRKHLKAAMAKFGTSSRFVAASALAELERLPGASNATPFGSYPPRGIPPERSTREDWASAADVGASGWSGDLNEERAVFQRTWPSAPATDEQRGMARPNGLTPVARIFVAMALILLIAVVITSAIPMSNAAQQIANAIDPP